VALTAERDKFEAALNYDEALKIQDKMTALAFSSAKDPYQAAIMYSHTGHLQSQLENFLAAEKAYNKCIDLALAQSPYEDWLIESSKGGLGWLYLQSGRWKEALANCKEAEEYLRQPGDEKSLPAIDLKLTLSSVLRRKGDYDGARKNASEALAFTEKRGDKPLWIALAKLRLAQVEYCEGNIADAENDFKALANLCKASKYRDLLGYIKTRLAEIELAKGNLQLAKELSDEAFSQYSDEAKKNSLFIVEDMVVAAKISIEQKQFEQAEKTLQKAITITDKAGDGYNTDRVDAWKAYANLLKANNREAEAKEMDAKATSMQKAYDSVQLLPAK
jgi:tetratricopeptide (TPR) repeat protein